MSGWIEGVKARLGFVAPQEQAIAAALLRSDRFRQAREGDWRRLDAIVARLERGRLRGLSDADLLDLPVLYRGLVSSLSIARETSLDAATTQWLEELAQRAWFQLHGSRQGFWAWLRGFFGGGWSRAVRALGVDLWIAFGVLVVGTVLGWMLVAHDAGWYGALVGGDGVRVPGATREALRGTLFGHTQEGGLAAFAAYLFGHNAQIAILCFALGFAFGVPTLMLLVQNAGMLGGMLWLFHGRGLTFEVVGWLAIHGTTELFAITLAGAAGLHIGRAVAFPGGRGVAAAASAAGCRAAVVMLGVVLMLVVAGLLEGFARQLVEDTGERLAIGGAMLALWLAYFFGFRRG